MNFNSLSGTNWFQRLEGKFLSGLQSTASSAQTAVSGSADSAATAAGAAATTAASAYIAGAMPSNQFAPDVLSALISAQSSPPSSSQVAQGLISSLDGNGDGSLSLGEVAGALGSRGGDSGVSAAFARIDTDGDGQLNAGELAGALDTAEQAVQNGQGARHMHGHHGHHHDHHAWAANQPNPAAVDVTTTTTTTTTTADAPAA